MGLNEKNTIIYPPQRPECKDTRLLGFFEHPTVMPTYGILPNPGIALY
jgi:hypothetical protein